MQKEFLNISFPEFYEEDYANMPMIDSTEGSNLKWNYEGKDYISENFSKKQRKARLVITSWVGVSGDAIHMYGKLIVDDLYFHPIDNPEHLMTTTAQPIETNGVTIHIRRPLPKDELFEYQDRYKGYRIGDYITGFLSKDELIAAAKKIIDEKFIGNWKLVIDDHS